jgi:hypothetical protein
MVRPQSTSVRVHLPKGYTADKLPEGWTDAGRGTVVWADRALDDSPRFTLVVRRG